MSRGYNSLIALADEEECNIAVFGHTHITTEDEIKGIKILNPGSAKYGGSYGIIEIEDGNISTCIIQE